MLAIILLTIKTEHEIKAINMKKVLIASLLCTRVDSLLEDNFHFAMGLDNTTGFIVMPNKTRWETSKIRIIAIIASLLGNYH
jgi:CTP-dependent riboflavin kinase